MEGPGNIGGCNGPEETKTVDNATVRGADNTTTAEKTAVVEPPAIDSSKANDFDGPLAETPTEEGDAEGDNMDVDKNEELQNYSEASDDKDGKEAERRTSKRMRTSLSDSRFEPGEGGGLASKKPRVNDESGPSPQGQPGPVHVMDTSAAKIGGAGNAGSSENKAGAKTKGGSDSSEKRTGPSFRWMDEGEKRDDVVVHQGVEITLGNDRATNGTPGASPFIVRPGDAVMLSSRDVPRVEPKLLEGSSGKQAIYNDPASREAGIGSLDPFIGMVERLWEEDDQSKKGGPGKKKGKSAKASQRLMVRVRWFFKREDVAGLNGVVIEGKPMGGDAKEKLLSTLGPHDLVLTDRSDDNAASTILRKVQVVRQKPLDETKEGDAHVPKGSYVCRYDLSFSETQGAARLRPYSGSSSSFGGESGAKRRESKDIDMSDPTSTDDEVVNTHYAATMSPFPMSPRRVISEGPTVGKIKVGADHQAEIPPKLDLERKTSFRGLSHPPSQRIPTMVWDPAADDDDAVGNFLDECSSLIVEHLKSIDLQPFHDVDENYIEAVHPTVEAKRPREADIDQLLTELHDCRGDASKAIQKISVNPEKYMTIWTKADKEQYDIGHRTYRESLRMVASTLEDSKSCKDTVDYHYRFKLVENFRRFKRKKLEKAEEIMATVEDRMLNEKAKEDARKRSGGSVEADGSSSEEEEGGKVATTINEKAGCNLTTALPTTHVGPVNNRVRTWFRTAGGDENVVGATQGRRNRAADLLSQVGQRVGKDACAKLLNSIKACNTGQASNSTLVDVKATARDVLQAHPDLLERFIDFLPKQVRSN